ncbi:hypothetical protein CROQUDRAFT_687228, partial [Cronartium quercuum f. sp. fusiforme G11]
MVKMRNKDYEKNDSSKDQSSSERERESPPETTTTPQISPPTQSTLHTLPLPSIFSPVRIPSTQQSSPSPNCTMSDMIPEWKTITFRSHIPTIVKNSGAQLQNNGLNYREWEFKIRNIVNDYTVRGWLNKADMHIEDPEGDQIVLMMIRYSLDVDIAMKIEDAKSAAEAMATIKMLFYFPSWSKQVSCFRELVSTKLGEDDDVNTYLRSISKGFDELVRDGFVFTKDSVMAMVYEAGLPEKYSNVTSTLNTVLRSKPIDPITAKQVEELIRSQKSLNKQDKGDNDVLPSFSNLDLGHTRNMNPIQQRSPHNYRAGSNRPPSTHPIDRCLACNEKGHWAWACPYNPRRQKVPPKTYNTPNRQEMWQQGPSKPSTRTPQYGKKNDGTPMKVNFADVDGNTFEAEVSGDLPDGVWTSEGCLRSEGENDDLGDTGASHNVTGDVSRLTEFKQLPHPIPLFVATKAPINFITGRRVITYTSDN